MGYKSKLFRTEINLSSIDPSRAKLVEPFNLTISSSFSFNHLFQFNSSQRLPHSMSAPMVAMDLNVLNFSGISAEKSWKWKTIITRFFSRFPLGLKVSHAFQASPPTTCRVVLIMVHCLRLLEKWIPLVVHQIYDIRVGILSSLI